ncbi:MAG: hypothetical protein M0Z28_09675 [Rhodospirillales bacterium]|nr:hypothetical protein [Rhodospirillales bacterium]
MDSEYAESPAEAPALEDVLRAADIQLAEAERQVAAVLRSLRRLRRGAQEGALAGLAPAASTAAEAVAQAAQPLARAAAALDYDVAAAFGSGAYLRELAAAAKQAGLTLVQRDGRITSYPVVLRLDARAQGVRVGRRLERRIRPEFLAAQLKTLQARPDRFNARAFLDRLLKPYALLARAEDAGWRANQPGTGPLLPLADLHEMLTLWPAAAADYPVEEFTCDLLRLDRHPDAQSGQGHRFELGGSTGKKGGKRLTLFDEAGVQHDYYAIRFILDA